eukprot:scaffold6865_cov97-Isochrysis_galbana.AAC.2
MADRIVDRVLVCARHRLIADPKVQVLDAFPVLARLPRSGECSWSTRSVKERETGGGNSAGRAHRLWILRGDDGRDDERRLGVASIPHLRVARPVVDHDGRLLHGTDAPAPRVVARPTAGWRARDGRQGSRNRTTTNDP